MKTMTNMMITYKPANAALFVRALCLVVATIASTLFIRETKAQGTVSGDFKAIPEKTTINWKATKVTGEHSGIVKLKSGVFHIKEGKLKAGTVEINMMTIEDTDMQPGEYKTKLENHLKSDDFFSVEKHPVAKFEFMKAEFVKDKNYNITGNLTIKGITNEVSFPAIVDITEAKMEGMAAVITIDRTKWDIRYGSGKFFEGLGDKMIHDEFKLNVKVGAVK